MTKIFSVQFVTFLSFLTASFISASSFAQSAATPATEARAQLHVPWQMLQDRLQLAIAPTAAGIDTTVASFPLSVGGVDWTLSNVEFKTGGAGTAQLDSTHAVYQMAQTPITIRVGAVSVDQMIDDVIDGVTVHVHLVASCGPLVLSQPGASLSTSFGLSWASGSVQATPGTTDLAWPARSWTLSDFTCTGPAGLTDVFRTDVMNYFNQADHLKPVVAQFINSTVQDKLSASLTQLRSPFAVSAQSTPLAFTVGALTPVSTGVIADVAVTAAGATSTLPAQLVPSASVLAALPLTQPVLIGDIAAVQFLLQSVLPRANYFTVDLQANHSFHSLMTSRFLQFFVWADLLNYNENSPFDLQVYRPDLSNIQVASGARLQTTFNLQAIAQSFRDTQWWTWITAQGFVSATIQMSAAAGSLSYQTTLSQQSVKLNYAAAYRAKYHKTNHPPSLLLDAINGPQTALSGTVRLPSINLGSDGSYDLSGVQSLPTGNVLMLWSASH